MVEEADVRLRPNDDRGPMLLGITWTTAAMATMIVILRVYSRTILQNAMGLDDFAIIAALVGISGFFGTVVLLRLSLTRRVLALNTSRASVAHASGS